MNTLPDGNTFTLKGKEFSFSIATSPLQLMRGLKGVRDLSPFEGMVFDFGSEIFVIMTPRGCEIPLEVAFLNESGTIVEFTKLDPQLGFTRAASQLVRYALEVPVGFFAAHNIVVGDALKEKE